MSDDTSLAHRDGCPCTRCTGFQPGHELSKTHGAYALLSLQPRAKSLRDELAPLVPYAAEADSPLLDLLAMTLVQVERAGLVLAVDQAESAARTSIGEEPIARLDRLAADARSWVNTAAKILDQLGMSPTARARLGLDLARTGDALAHVADEGRRIREAREAA